MEYFFIKTDDIKKYLTKRYHEKLSVKNENDDYYPANTLRILDILFYDTYGYHMVEDNKGIRYRWVPYIEPYAGKHSERYLTSWETIDKICHLWDTFNTGEYDLEETNYYIRDFEQREYERIHNLNISDMISGMYN
jgi:hypothetical protein